MFPDEFDYYRADDVDEAIELLSKHPGAELLAGGHSLLPTMKSGLASPNTLIDIANIPELSGIEVGEETTTFGAATRYVDVLDHDGAAETCPAFVETAAEIGDRQVRNAGTVGGNLAHADPASDLPAVVLAADATMHIHGQDGERAVPSDEFFIAMYTTSVEEGEILTAIECPNIGSDGAATYVKKSSPSSGYAVIGVAVRLERDGDALTDARVAAAGAFETARRLEPVEAVLEGADSGEAGLAERAAAEATADVEAWELMDDIRVSGEFRGHLLEVYTARAVEQALDRLPAAPPA